MSQKDSLTITAQDEYLHTPQDDPYWWENFYFVGYDTQNQLGISLATSIKPVMGLRHATVTLHTHNTPPLYLWNEVKLEEDAYKTGSLKMDVIEPLKKWHLSLKDTFTYQTNTTPSTEIVQLEFDIADDAPPHGYKTPRGCRYELPCTLKGTLKVGNTTYQFNSKGHRDHSWEIRKMVDFEKTYFMMGRFKSGAAISFIYAMVNKQEMCRGWFYDGQYHPINQVTCNPQFLDTPSETWHIKTSVPSKNLTFNTKLISKALSGLSKDEAYAGIIETWVSVEDFEEGGQAVFAYILNE